MIRSLLLACLLFSCAARAEQTVEFAKRKIKIAHKVITVEIADTQEKREHGLMFRTKLDRDAGMLFVFEWEQPMAFWMKNTLIPLSLAYFDHDRKVVGLVEMVPAIAGEAYPPSYPSRKPALYALEMDKGWFAKNHVKVGDTFSFADEAKKAR